jgi:hypothetical protein
LSQTGVCRITRLREAADDLAGQNTVAFGDFNHAFWLAGFVVDGFPFANRRIAGGHCQGADASQDQGADGAANHSFNVHEVSPSFKLYV